MIAGMDLPSVVAVEALLEKARDIPPDASSFELWVPAALTFEGRPILRAVGVAILHDAMEAKGFEPVEAAHAQEGTLCSYRRKVTG